METFESLPEDQQLAIELLVLGDPDMSGKPMKYNDIAEKCGVTPMTLRRWRATAEFQTAKREFRERMKGDIIDEAIKTLRRSMRTKDSTHAAEIALKWAGEMIERRAVEANVNTTQTIDIRNSDHAQLLEKIREHQKALGIDSDIDVYLSPSVVKDGEIVVEGGEKDEK